MCTLAYLAELGAPITVTSMDTLILYLNGVFFCNTELQKGLVTSGMLTTVAT